MGRDDQLFSSSFCVFFIGLLFQQILFLHSNLKRRKVFGPVAFSLVWSPFYQERFHIANNSYLLAICKEWKLGLWRKRKKDFPEQRSAFQVLVWFFVCFGLGFFLLYKQYWLVEGVYTRDSQRTEFGLKILTWLWNIKAERGSKALVLPKGLHWKCLFSFLQPLYFNCQSSLLNVVFPEVSISIL